MFKSIKNPIDFSKRTCKVMKDDNTICGKPAIAALAPKIEDILTNEEYDICVEHKESMLGNSLLDVKGLPK